MPIHGLLHWFLKRIGMKDAIKFSPMSIPIPYAGIQLVNLERCGRYLGALRESLTLSPLRTIWRLGRAPASPLGSADAVHLQLLAKMESEYLEWELERNIVQLPQPKVLLAVVGLSAVLLVWTLIPSPPPTLNLSQEEVAHLEEIVAEARRFALFTARTPSARQAIKDRVNQILSRGTYKELSEAAKERLCLAAVHKAFIPTPEEAAALGEHQANAHLLTWAHNLVRRGWDSLGDWAFRRLPTR